MPFFWYDPPWHLVDIDRARDMAWEMAAAGVVVAALHRDLSASDESDASSFLPRMAPHRCDRAGWIYRDCQSASILELRLVLPRDRDGAFAYHARQLTRWRHLIDAGTEDAFGRSDAMSFPPDWSDLDGMAAKVIQLRRLSTAAVFVSFDALDIDTLLPVALAADVDGVIVTVEDDPVQTIVQARDRLQKTERPHRPELWIATRQSLPPEEAVKCLALGATGLGIDAVCNDYLWNGNRAETSIAQWVRQVRGMARSCGVERLTDLRPDHLIAV
ncbi:MAG: hypothetical protein ACO1RT_03035 [Planctomycetaceae bacterium]